MPPPSTVLRLARAQLHTSKPESAESDDLLPSTEQSQQPTSHTMPLFRAPANLPSWVMLKNADYVLLPNEKSMVASPSRVALSLKSPHTYPGSHPVNVSCGSGQIHLTNLRLIYLPEQATEQLQSFSAPLANLYDSHVSAPWFGANIWTAVLKPVPGGGLDGQQRKPEGAIPTNHNPQLGLLEMKLTFKDGGAFDFHSTYERVRERMLQVSSLSEGLGAGAGPSANAVDLEDLPAYEATEGSGPPGVPGLVRGDGSRSLGGDTSARPEKEGFVDHGEPRMDLDDTAGFEESRGERDLRERRVRRPKEWERREPPDEPPPGYDEATKD